MGGGVKMCDKMAISAHILKIVENDPFLRLQMTSIKEIHNFTGIKGGGGSGRRPPPTIFEP